MIVLDASAAVAVLLNLGAGARRIRERMEQEDNDLHVSQLFEIEVINALGHHALRHGISERRGLELLEDSTTLSISRYAHTAMLHRIWELRDNVSAYDAAYIALAETLEAPSSPGTPGSPAPPGYGPRWKFTGKRRGPRREPPWSDAFLPNLPAAATPGLRSTP